MQSSKRWIFIGMMILLPICSVQATFHPGDSGDDIFAVQNKLAALGYHLGADGVYGPATEAAVKEFQASHGLEVDGLVGPATYRALIGRDIPVSRSGFDTLSVRRLISVAQKFIGVPYAFGGTTPSGFDCSGFVQYVARSSGVALPRMADEQYQMGHSVSRDQLRAGDLVFFSTYESGVSHSGIYLGYGRFISATSSRGVAIDSMNDGYWNSCYVGARRLL